MITTEYLNVPITNDSAGIINAYSEHTDDTLYLDSEGDNFYEAEIAPDSVTIEETVPPFLDNISYPFQIEPNEDIDINVSIGDESIVEYASIYITYPSGYTEEMPMSYVSISTESGYNITLFTYSFSNTSEIGSYEFYIVCEDIFGNSRSFGAYSFENNHSVFDTGQPQNPYPSISGTHNGTITPSWNLTVSKLYTYACAGTGGQTESVRIYGNGIDENASWTGYTGDWPNLTFHKLFTLEAGKTYNYEIRTGSYSQIHHTPALPTDNGWINCTSFEDANGNLHTDWIPAVRLWSE